MEGNSQADVALRIMLLDWFSMHQLASRTVVKYFKKAHSFLQEHFLTCKAVKDPRFQVRNLSAKVQYSELPGTSVINMQTTLAHKLEGPLGLEWLGIKYCSRLILFPEKLECVKEEIALGAITFYPVSFSKILK